MKDEEAKLEEIEDSLTLKVCWGRSCVYFQPNKKGKTQGKEASRYNDADDFITAE